jgi:hypothetical protein
MNRTQSWFGILTVATVGLGALGGCGAGLGQLKTRAAVDLECPADSLVLSAIDPATRRVSGCGKEAIYVEQFNDARHATWLLNSTILARSSPK